MHASGELTIINFHGIGEPTRLLEPGEAPFWLSRDQFCAVLDRIAARADPHRFAITFDDSNTSDLTIAVPELQKRELTATFFILTGRFCSQGSLDRADVKEIVASGMDIGSHGIDHRDLTRLSPAELDNELIRSKIILEDVHSQPVSTVSIPFGRYNARVLRAIRKAGYSGAYTSDGGSANKRHFLRPRRSLRCDMSTEHIEDLLADEATFLGRMHRGVRLVLKRLR